MYLWHTGTNLCNDLKRILTSTQMRSSCNKEFIEIIKKISRSKEAFLAGQMISLNRHLGLQTVEVEELLHFMQGKVIISHVVEDISTSVGPPQIYSSRNILRQIERSSSTCECIKLLLTQLIGTSSYKTF